MSGIPTTALTGGAGGNPMDSPGTSPPPSTVTAPLGDSAGGGGGVAADEGEGGAPVPFPGEEEGEEDDDEEEDEEEAEDGEEGDADEDGNAKAGPSRSRSGSQGEVDASEAAGTKTSGKGAGKGKGAAAKKVAASQPGITPLPTARVKKIILSDPDVDSCGKEATFAIGKACELYIHHLVEAAYTQARLDKRKAVVYKDISRAIKSTPYLEFLMDVVPAPVSLSSALQERQRHTDMLASAEGAADGDAEMNGSTYTEAPAADTSSDPILTGEVDGVMNGVESTSALAAGPEVAQLDTTAADQLRQHHLPPGAANAAGQALRGTEAEIEEIGTIR